MRLLFVEDNAAFVAVVCASFLSAHKLVIARSAGEARTHVGGAFDAALVDYDLPDGKGDAVVEALLHAQPNLDIVAISSHAEGNAALRAAGATHTCAKSDFHRIEDVLRAARTPQGRPP